MSREQQNGYQHLVLGLFQLYRNAHVFARGKREGSSPFRLAGIDTPEGDRLDRLGLGRQTRSHSAIRLPSTAGACLSRHELLPDLPQLMNRAGGGATRQSELSQSELSSSDRGDYTNGNTTT